MQFKDTPEEAAFREQIRTFIRQNLPSQWSSPLDFEEGPDPNREAFIRQWRKQLGERGWIAPHWPREYGGAGMTPTEQFIFNQEMAEARAPQVGGMGVQMIGPGSGEIIAVAAALMQAEVSIHDLAALVAWHPSMTESLVEAARRATR